MTARVETGDRERHGVVFHPDNIEEHASAVLLAKDIADYLERQYQGWLWALGVDSRGGVVTIRSMRLSSEWGYVIKLDLIQHDPKVRQRLVLKAAGEILERYGCRAGAYDREQFARIRRDLAGRPAPDLTDKPVRVRRRERDEALTAAVRSGAVTLRHQDSRRPDGSRYRRILIAGGQKPNVQR
jgi:hypothetical protein